MIRASKYPTAAGSGPPLPAIQLLIDTAQPTPTIAPKPMAKKSIALTPFLFSNLSTPFLNLPDTYTPKEYLHQLK
jgi:hypothetical protein